MKTLKQRIQESILGSTKTGKNMLVWNWLKDNLNYSPEDLEKRMEIDSKGKIVNKGTWNIVLNNYNIPTIPDYVQFGEIKTSMYLGNNANKIKENQLGYIEKLYIAGDTKKLENKTFNLGSTFIVESPQKDFKEIKNLTLNFARSASKIILSLTEIDLKSFNEIHTNAYRIEIENTPAAKELVKKIRKVQKTATTPEALDEFFKETLPNIQPSTRFIKLSSRTTIEQNPKNGHWYVF